MLLTHTNRIDRICVLTLDRYLAGDVKERVSADSRMSSLEVLQPWRPGQSVQVQDVLRLAPLSTTCRLIVLDTRRRYLPRVQEAYNRVSCYNRQDFNRLCFSIIITDGPAGFPSADVGVGAFRAIIARARLDYSAAAVFFDPLIHDPRLQYAGGIGDRSNELLVPEPDLLPSTVWRLPDARSYLRGPRGERSLRQGQVMARWAQYAFSRYPTWASSAEATMSADGAPVPGETLPLRTYPFHFEDFLNDCLNRTKSSPRIAACMEARGGSDGR
jgi:hypothetical protein